MVRLLLTRNDVEFNALTSTELSLTLSARQKEQQGKVYDNCLFCISMVTLTSGRTLTALQLP